MDSARTYCDEKLMPRIVEVGSHLRRAAAMAGMPRAAVAMGPVQIWRCTGGEQAALFALPRGLVRPSSGAGTGMAEEGWCGA